MASLTTGAVGARRFGPALRARLPVGLLSRGVVKRGWLLIAGRALLVLGVVLGLFMIFELFFTSMFEGQAQANLLSQFQTNIKTTTLDRPNTTPAVGSAVAVLSIPRLGVNDVVAEGSTVAGLKSGPGHLRASPIPGEFGNSVIVGHRTTYGAPFGRIGSLRKGDTIRVLTGQGVFTYVVKQAHRIQPGQTDPVLGTSDSRLTLMTSDPPYSATGRLVVIAMLKGNPIAVATRAPVLVGDSELGLTGDALGLALGIIWAQVLILVAWVGWRQRHRWPQAVLYLLGVPLVLALLVLTFTSFDMLLPGSL